MDKNPHHTIQQNLNMIRENIAAAAAKSSRKAEDILLVGVTKTIGPERINALTRLGVRDLGENKAQELLSKQESVKGALRWHFIGHLQTNKVKSVIGKVHLIHSVDSFRLLEEINRRSAEQHIQTDVLLEVNIALEEAKYGIKEADVENFLLNAYKYTNICIKGLMTVAPYVENQEENRVFFRKMRKLFIDISAQTYDNVNMSFLSMGMTGDYTVAIEEGSNIVRIGTGLFGERNYTVS